MYTAQQRKKALSYYRKCKSVTKTVQKLGYPTIQALYTWIKEDNRPVKSRAKNRGTNTPSHPRHPPVELKLAIIKRCFEEGEDVKKVSEETGYSRMSIYKWRRMYLQKGTVALMNPKDIKRGKLKEGSEVSSAEVEELRKKVDELQFQVDLMKEILNVIKKDPGINLRNLRNREKAVIVDAVKDHYSLPLLLKTLGLSRSSYYYQKAIERREDKYKGLREKISILFNENDKRYGYRRINGLLKRSGLTVSEKVVRRIMKEDSLIVKVRKRKKYSSYKGEISPSVPNLIQRDFHADRPNEKWLTDITEFALPDGKVYLSSIVDCFDGMIPAWTIGTSPDAELVNTMLEKGLAQLSQNEHPVIHSDRGCHYRWPGWISRMENAGLTRSMSRKGYSPDNAACEGLFGRIKNEMFYNHSWNGVSIPEFIQILDDYLNWYNKERIKVSLGNKSPVEYRQSLGLPI